MAELKQKIQNALDENRILVLGVQVLIGFDYRSVFEPGFEQLPRWAQLLKIGTLSILCLTFALLLAPSADHRIGERGEDSTPFHRLTTAFASLALFPFAIGLGGDMASAGLRVGGIATALAAGLMTTAAALIAWYGIELWFRLRVHEQPQSSSRSSRMPSDTVQKTDIGHKIRHVLTEARVVLPGAQALLGFQFATMLTDGFDKLGRPLQRLHLAGLCATALAVILLMTPAAWHRLVEHGEENERFHRFASHMVEAALVPVALGILADFFIVVEHVTHARALATAFTAALAFIFFALWFGLGLVRRALQKRTPAVA